MKKRELLSRLVTPIGTKGPLLSRLPDPGQKGTPFVPDWRSRLGNRDNSGFPTGTNQRFCSSVLRQAWNYRQVIRSLCIMSIENKTSNDSFSVVWNQQTGEIHVPDIASEERWFQETCGAEPKILPNSWWQLIYQMLSSPSTSIPSEVTLRPVSVGVSWAQLTRLGTR